MQTFVSFRVSVDEKSAEWRHLELYGLQRARTFLLRKSTIRNLFITHILKVHIRRFDDISFSYSHLKNLHQTCKKYAKDEELVKCSRCGRFYHLDDECTGEYCIWKEPKNEDSMPEFICGAHFCHACGRENPHTKCFRCVIAYHQECRPPDVHDLDDRYFVCIKHIQADQEKKKDEEVEEKEVEVEEQQRPKLRLAPRKRKSDSMLDSLSFQDIGVIGVTSTNTKNIELVEEGEDYSVSGGIDVSVFKDEIPHCMKCNATFNVEWSHKQCIFVVIDAEVHIEREDQQITEYRHKRGFCSRKRLRKCK